ncbi:MAG: multi-sensor signal transduction histidine kinase [Bacteroidetes bacterium]|nr:MAG: multi-sensor signal transduction histidine kinase [Bacteroidota bacterium]
MRIMGKKTKKKAPVREGFFRKLIENSFDGIVISAPDGIVKYVSPSIERILGYTQEEHIGTHPAVIVHPEDLEMLVGTFARVLEKNGNIVHAQWRKKHKDGSWRWLEGIAVNMLNVTGINGVVTNFRDITERKRAEEALRNAEANYREIFEKASDAIFVHDMETGLLVDINQKSCEMTGFSRQETLEGGPALFLSNLPGYTMQDAMNYIQKAATTGPQIFEWLAKRKDGSLYWLEVSLTKATIAGTNRILAFFREIDERKRAEQELKRYTRELEAKNKELEQFAYITSHDLQEPLRTLNSYVDLLSEQFEGKTDEKTEKYMEYVLESSERMKNLIKGLMDYSRIGAERKPEKIDCNMLIDEVKSDLETLIKQNGAVVICGKLPVIKGYAMEMKVLFQNLVSNAVKFCRPGEKPEITISAREKNNAWEFSVKDNGIGIDMKYKDKIFIIFQRLHSRKEYEGTGIGLAHSRKIVELHGGEIRVESLPGAGSTFYFTIAQ